MVGGCTIIYIEVKGLADNIWEFQCTTTIVYGNYRTHNVKVCMYYTHICMYIYIYVCTHLHYVTLLGFEGRIEGLTSS